jgi:hypothetical protein
LVRHHVHANVHGADHAPEFGLGFYRQLGVAAILKGAKNRAGSPKGSSIGARRASSACSGCAFANELI